MCRGDPMIDPEVLQSGFGLNFKFGLANFRRVIGEFFQQISPCQGFRPPHTKKISLPKFAPKVDGVPLQIISYI